MTRPARRAELSLRRPSGWRYLTVGISASLLLTALLVWVRAEFGRSTQLRAQLVASYERRTGQIVLLSQLKDVETAQRGYLLTRQPAFLHEFEARRRAVETHLSQLGAISSGHVPADYQHQVMTLARAKLDGIDRSIRLARAGQFDAAGQMLRSGRGKRLMDRLRAVIGGMIARETTLSRQRLHAFIAQRNQLQRQMTAIYVGLVVALAVILGALWRTQRARFAALGAAFEAGERNATILDSTTDALLILDGDGRIDVVNAAAVAMLGYDAHALTGLAFTSIVGIGEDRGDFRQRIGLVDGQLRRSFLADCSARHRDGHEIAVDIAIGAMPDGPDVSLVVSLRDISERKRIERVKDELISTVSHELRTPLTSVVGALSLLRSGSGGPLPQAAARLIEIAEGNSQRLIRLINDMLDIDRIDSGKLRLSRRPIDLRHVVEQACDGSEGLARSSAVTLACRVPDAPVMVDGDADRLVQVVTNLLSNAIRASRGEGLVEARLSVDARGRALITVDDRGGGIPLAFRDRIFGRFERANRADGATGTGLGLAISREIVARHGGSIWFEDRAGGGTRFAVAIDRVDGDRGGDGARRIVIIQPDDDNGRQFARAIREGGYPVDVEHEAGGLMQAIAAREYALLLINLDLAPASRRAMAEIVLRHDPPFVTPYVLVSSAIPATNGRPAAMDMAGWIEKPVDADRLAGALRGALRRAHSARPVILRLDDDCAALDVVLAGIVPDARIVTAANLAAAGALVERAAPDIAIVDLPLHGGADPGLLPFLVDAQGRAIPTIVYATVGAHVALAARFRGVVVGRPGTIPDPLATIRRIIEGRSRTEADA